MNISRNSSDKISGEQQRGFDIVKKLADNGFKALFVGGAVRDMFIKDMMNEYVQQLSDFDILTNAPIEEITRVFAEERVKKVGKAFAICMVNGVEVASCRSELPVKSSLLLNEASRLPLDSQSDLSKSSKNGYYFPECDLAHRDITINSMAFDPLTGKVVDPFGGKRDIKDRIIRFTGNPDERIAEDPLRMVRACRFVSLIEGTIEPATISAIIRHRSMVMDRDDNQNIVTGTVAPERVRHEILKAMAHKRPSLFFRALHSCKLLELIFPSIFRCAELDGGPHHGETVFEHCLLTGDAISPRNPTLRLAAYLHDAGKYDAAFIKDGYLTFPDHEKMVDSVVNDLYKLRFSNEEIVFIAAVIRTHMRPLTSDSTPKAVRRLLAFLKENNVAWQTFMQMRIADKSANLAKKPYSPEEINLRVGKIRQELKGCKIKGVGVALSVKDLRVSGDDIMKILNIPEGPEVGKIMNYLFECVLDEPSLNSFDALVELVMQYRSLK